MLARQLNRGHKQALRHASESPLFSERIQRYRALSRCATRTYPHTNIHTRERDRGVRSACLPMGGREAGGREESMAMLIGDRKRPTSNILGTVEIVVFRLDLGVPPLHSNKTMSKTNREAIYATRFDHSRIRSIYS